MPLLRDTTGVMIVTSGVAQPVGQLSESLLDMWEIGSLFILFSALRLAAVLSHFNRKRYIWLVSFGLAEAVFALHGYSENVSMAELQRLLFSSKSISALNLWLVIEAGIIGYLGVGMIHCRFSGKAPEYWQMKLLASLSVPSFFFCAVALQTYLFNAISGTSFFQISFRLSLAIAFLIPAISLTVRNSLKNSQRQVEIIFFSTALQALIVIGFQQVSSGLNFESRISSGSFFEFVQVLSLFIILIIPGYINHKYLLGKKIWRFFSKGLTLFRQAS